MKITDKIKIEVDLDIIDALRSMVVLGKTNGAGSGELWRELKNKVDPKNLFNSRDVADDLGVISYRGVQEAVHKKFFGLYEKYENDQKLNIELETLKREACELQSRISKIQEKLGE